MSRSADDSASGMAFVDKIFSFANHIEPGVVLVHPLGSVAKVGVFEVLSASLHPTDGLHLPVTVNEPRL